MIKVGIIGFGDGGQSNAKALLKNDEIRVIAICDIDHGKWPVAWEMFFDASRYFRAADRDYTYMINKDDIDLVIVATPDPEHFRPAAYALNKGKFVFVEKPVATNLGVLKAFNELVKEFPRKILFSEKYSFAYPVQAALAMRDELGEFMAGSTLYTMWKCDRIMGNGQWRTEHAYNPCAGGLSHNFMTAILFTDSPIARVRATGQILTYHENLDTHGGFDTMEGTLEFKNGKRLQWLVCLAIQGEDSPFAHRTVTHTLQFEHGSLVYGPTPESDRLIVNGQSIPFQKEPQLIDPIDKERNLWAEYNIGVLYKSMHEDLLKTIREGKQPLHNIHHGINVAASCVLAFDSAKADGRWIDIPEEFQF